MGFYIQILSLVIVGVVLLMFGYSLFFGPWSPFLSGWWRKKQYIKGMPGQPMVCPLCSVKMTKGDLVKTHAYPSMTGGRERLMYIHGCYNCLEEGQPRRCPVCMTELSIDDFLVSRMFERSPLRNHVHVLGCNHCKVTGTITK